MAVSWRVCYAGGIGRIGQIYDEILSPLVFRSRSFTFAQKTSQRLPVTPSRWDRQAAGGSSSHQVGLVAWSSPRHCSYRQGCHYSMAGRRRRRTEKKEAIVSLQLRPAGIKTWLARIPPHGKTGKTCMDHQRQAAALISGAHSLGTRSAPRLLGNPAVSTPTYPSIVSARAAARPTVDGPSINDPKLARVIVTTIFIPSRFCPITLLSHAFVQISLLQNAHRAKHRMQQAIPTVFCRHNETSCSFPARLSRSRPGKRTKIHMTRHHGPRR